MMPCGAEAKIHSRRWAERLGESTIAEMVVSHHAHIERFMNADTLARGFAAFNPDLAAVTAGKALLQEADRLIEQRIDFAVETTLSGRGWANRVKGSMRHAGYHTHLAFVYLPVVEANVRRVAQRVAAGGHDIPEADIRRRHSRALNNLFRVFLPIVNTFEIFDNSQDVPRMVAKRDEGASIEVLDAIEWRRLESRYG